MCRKELKNYPPNQDNEAVAGRTEERSRIRIEKGVHILILPQRDNAIIIRPLTEAEYASFQIQAVGYWIIERQMLARSILHPICHDTTLEEFDPELVRFIKRGSTLSAGLRCFPASASIEQLIVPPLSKAICLPKASENQVFFDGPVTTNFVKYMT